MLSNTNYARLKFLQGGQPTSQPAEWPDVGVLATFTEGDVQANVTLESVTLRTRAYLSAKAWIAAGNAFEGQDYKIIAENKNGRTTLFDGYLDFQTAEINDTEGFVKIQLAEKDSLTSLRERLRAVSFELLKEKGYITPSDYTDVDYVVVKIDYTVEAILQSIMLYILYTQLAEAIRAISDAVSEVAALAANPLTTPNSIILAAAKLIINALYAASILLQIVDLGRKLIEAFIQPKRTHKAMTYQRLLEVACNYFGYGFNTSYPLDRIVYLPSNTRVDEFNPITAFLQSPGTIRDGFPNTQDVGYNCAEFFDLCERLFNGRFAIQNGIVQFHRELSQFWRVNSTYSFPDALALQSPYRYNTDEINSSVFLAFSTDLADGYTLQNFKGTNFQVLTDVANKQAPQNIVIKGSITERFPIALGNRKNDLNGFEKTLATLAGIFDSIINTISRLFGQGRSSNFQGQIRNRVGVLKVENNNHSIPKILWLQNGRLPANHRDKISARRLWELGWEDVSFIANNYRRQRRIYEGIEIPFGLEDYRKLTGNSYIANANAKVTELEARLGDGKATVSFWREEIYTQNLEETYIEPE